MAVNKKEKKDRSHDNAGSTVRKGRSQQVQNKVSQPHEYETMSQVQNRYGKGREHSGSDGSKDTGNFSNH